MFESLTDKLGQALRNLRGVGKLSEENMAEALKEVRTALLSADVHFKVAREFVDRVQQQCTGQEVLKGVAPGQQVVKIIHDELVRLLGEGTTNLSGARPLKILMVGLHGSGKTTSTAKLGKLLKKRGYRPFVAACDVYRPAAIDQLETLGQQLDVPVYAERNQPDVVRIANAGIDQAKRARDRVVIVDTAGRLQIDDEMMGELERLKQAIRPDEILLVADGMTGQDAVKIAQGFDSRLGVTGVILTKMDGDARGGAALSIYGVVKKPIKYIGVGEKTDALEDFHPDRMAGRILQQGDIVTLVEKAQGAFDAEEAKKMEKKVRKEGMDLEDFLTAMKQIEKLGPLEGILKMLPGVNSKMLKQVKSADPKRMKHMEAIVLSMTKEERRKPDVMNGSRRARVAKGSGRPIQEVNRLLEQFREMQKMMKKMGAGAGGKMRMPPGMFGGLR